MHQNAFVGQAPPWPSGELIQRSPRPLSWVRGGEGLGKGREEGEAGKGRTPMFEVRWHQCSNHFNDDHWLSQKTIHGQECIVLTKKWVTPGTQSPKAKSCTNFCMLCALLKKQNPKYTEIIVTLWKLLRICNFLGFRNCFYARQYKCYSAYMPRQFRLSVRHTRLLYQNGWTQ